MFGARAAKLKAETEVNAFWIGRQNSTRKTHANGGQPDFTMGQKFAETLGQNLRAEIAARKLTQTFTQNAGAGAPKNHEVDGARAVKFTRRPSKNNETEGPVYANDAQHRGVKPRRIRDNAFGANALDWVVLS